MNGKRGFTIVEALVAILILSVGLVALTTVAASVTRMIGEGRRLTEAAALATDQMEVLRVRPCPPIGAGSLTRGPYAVAWEVDSAVGGRARAVTITVARATRRGTHADTLQTLDACP
jgi:prepilin-type N-terminal cleavage/methylation domain-containing protein